MSGPVLVFVLLHIVASALLAAFGYHRAQMARAFARMQRDTRIRERPAGPARRGDWPLVTVQLPLYNERYVAERVIRAAAALEYPSDRLEIQVLDDSTDDTTELVARVVDELQDTGVTIHHVRRASRTGYKAGALAEGLNRASGSLIAIFDADFVPNADFLIQVVPDFDEGDVAMVQARWGHINADTSLLTRTQALQLDAHFTTEHTVRARSGCFFNFNGTAGIWRRSAIESAGGWQADTLTEDLDLSYRAQLAGWRFIYRDDVEVPAELPAEIAAFRLQQQRWAQGGIQTARKILPTLLRSDLPAKIKRAATWHLLIHLSYPLLVIVTLAGLAVGLFADLFALRWVLAVDGLLLTFAMASLTYFYGVTARGRDPDRWRRRLWVVPAVMILGAGISLGQCAAVWRGLLGHRTPFRRTPKYKLAGGKDRSWRRAAYRISTPSGGIGEILAGAALYGAGFLEARVADVPPSGLVLLLGTGLVSVGLTSLFQQASLSRTRGHT